MGGGGGVELEDQFPKKPDFLNHISNHHYSFSVVFALIILVPYFFLFCVPSNAMLNIFISTFS